MHEFNHEMIGTTFTFESKPFTYTYLGKRDFHMTNNIHMFLVKKSYNSYINVHSEDWPNIHLNNGFLVPILNLSKKQIQMQLVSTIKSRKDLLKLKKIQDNIGFQDDVFMILRAFLGDTKMIDKKI